MQMVGTFLLVLAILFLLHEKLRFVGNLPGDLMFEHKNFKIYLPLGTALAVSLILSIVCGVLGKK